MTAQRKPPPVDPITGMYKVSPTSEWRACQKCGHLAWRIGANEWECGCPVGSGGCHAPLQRLSEVGVELVYLPYRFGDVQ
jgi:hypothetical protein